MECSYSKFESIDTSSEKIKKVTLSTITDKPTFTNGAFNILFIVFIALIIPLFHILLLFNYIHNLFN